MVIRSHRCNLHRIRAGWTVLTLMATTLFSVSGCQCNSMPTIPPADPNEPGVKEAVANTGSQLYALHCAGCHGENGNGHGVAARYLFPKPRDLRSGRFRLVSTTNGVPTPQDLEAVLVRGMPGSSMLSWAHLSEQQRKLLAEEVMRLRRDGARQQYIKVLKEEEELEDEEIDKKEVQKEIQEFVDRRTTPSRVSEVPEIGLANEDAIARGKKIYISQSCFSCHGNEGKGDGQQKMVDDEGLPTRPRDLTKGIFKGGHDVASIYRRIANGMPGTPMPSSQKLKPDEVIDLVHYTLAMSTEELRQKAILRREKIVAKRVDVVPSASEAGSWAAVEPVGIRMTPLWWRDDSDVDFQVQALHDGKTIAIRLSWLDATTDRHAARSDAFEDAVAVELYRGTDEPFVGMGSRKSPVDVWYWDADRQGPLASVEDIYPHTVVDRYPFSEKLVASSEYDRPGVKDADQPDISLPAKATGNLIVPIGAESGSSELTAAGPGSLTFRVPTSKQITARGQWQDGRWLVVMTRSLAVDSDRGVSLEPGNQVSAAFAVWDGSQRERDGKKLITIWQDLILEK